MKSVLRAYWPSVRQRVWLLMTAVVSLMIALSFQAVSPHFARHIVTVFTQPVPNANEAYTLLWKIVGIFVGINIAYRVFDLALTFFEARVMAHLDERSFAVEQAQSMCFFENTFTGSLVKSVTRFRNAFESMTDCLLELGKDGFILIVASVIFSATMPSFALAFGIWTTLFLGASMIAAFWKYRLDKANADTDSKVGGVLADSLSNHATVKSFGREDDEQERFNTIVGESYRKRIKAWMAGNIVLAMQGIMTGSAEIMMLWWMIRGWEQGTVTVGDFVFFQSYVVWILSHLWSFGRTVQKLFQHMADAQEMALIYERIPEVLDVPESRELLVTQGTIDFQSVTFGYADIKDKGRLVLHDFNLHIRAGQSVGFIGESGAGKTTIVQLLLRLRNLYSGAICIDGQNIAEVSQKSLRQRIGVVPQDPQLFHRTVRQNITFGNPHASEDEIMEAVHKACAWEFIRDLPQGLETLVGERGVKLSGGQRQRIAIARAILADPPILVFDEATSALDSETEVLIQQAIKHLLRGRTSAVIAHRLSTVAQLDRIVVIGEGRILEDGAHQELIDRQGPYANLWAHQCGGYIL